MVKALILPSAYDGRRVQYVDRMLVMHSGEVIGRSKDSQWYFVRSDNPNAPKTEWHFKIGRAMLPKILQTQSN